MENKKEIKKGDRVTVKGGIYKDVEFTVQGFHGEMVILTGDKMQITKGKDTIVKI